MEELIKYFEDKLQVTQQDLVDNEENRYYKYAQIDMLEEIKAIYSKGYPNVTK